LLRDVLRISPVEAKRRITHAHAVLDEDLVSGGTVAAGIRIRTARYRADQLHRSHRHPPSADPA
jgi:hypothetical protein